MASLGTAYIRIAPDLTGVQGSISRGLNKAATSSTTTKGLSGIGAVAAGAIGGAVALVASKAISMVTSSVGDAVKRVDILNNAPKVLQNLGFSAEDSTEAVNGLADGLKGLPSRLDEMAQNLVSVVSASGLGIKQSQKLTLAFNNMALAGGKGREGAATAFEALTTAMGKGKFDLLQYQRLVRVMPAQLKQLAETLLGSGSSAMDLYEAMKDGKVSMEDFQKGIVDLNTKGGKGFASFSDQAKDATKGIQTGWDNMQAAITRGVGKIITAVGSDKISSSIAGIGGAFEGALEKIADAISTGIDFINEHQEEFVNGAKAIGVAIAVFLIPPLWGLVSSLAAATIAAAPYIAVFTAIAGVAYLIIKNWDKVAPIFEAIGEVWSNKVMPVLKPAGEWIKNVFVGAWNDLKEAFDDVKASLSELSKQLQPIMPLLKAVGIAIAISIVAPIVLAIAGFAMLVAGVVAVGTIFAWLIGKLAKFFAFWLGQVSEMVTAWKKAWARLKEAWSNTINSFREGWARITNFARNAWNGIKNAFSNAGSWFKSNVVDRIVNAFSGLKGRITGFFKGVWSGVGSALKAVINSVLRLPLILPTIKAGGKTLVGGQTLIPALAQGAVITGPTLAMIGEGREPEAVIPLSKLDSMLESRGGGRGGATINQTNNVYTEIDMNVVNRNLRWELNRA